MLLSGCITNWYNTTFGNSEKYKLSNQHIAKGDSLKRAGNLRDAVEQYKIALTFDPDNDKTLKKKLNLENKLKRKADLHYQVGLKHLQKNRPLLARKNFLAALQNWPKHEKAREKITSGKQFAWNTKYITHTIRSGESISKLAMIYYNDYKKYTFISAYNNINDITKIYAGQKIKIPEIKKFNIKILQSRQVTYHAKIKNQVLSETDKTESIEAITISEEEEALTEEKELLQAQKDQKLDETDDAEDNKIFESDREILEEITAIDKTDREKNSIPLEDIQTSIQKSDEKKEVKNQTSQLLDSGITFFEQRKYNQAITSLEKALNFDSENEKIRDYLFKSYFQNGLAMFNKKEYLKARDNFKSAIQYNQECDKCHDYIEKSVDTYKNVHYNMGTHFFGKEKLEQAIEEWELVKEIDPEYKDIKTNLKKAKSLYQRLEDIKKSSGS